MSVAFTVTDRHTGDDVHVAVPEELRTLDDFRRWVATESVPEKLKLRFHRGTTEILMAAEEVESHVLLKGDLTIQLGQFVHANNLGRVFPDGTLLTNDEAQIANEPDLIFCRFETLQARKAFPRPSIPGFRHSIELCGSPDLVVEIVSKSSVRKDKIELRESYFEAGIDEYWIIDARRDGVELMILTRGDNGYDEVAVGADGSRWSAILGRGVEITRDTDVAGLYLYSLILLS